MFTDKVFRITKDDDSEVIDIKESDNYIWERAVATDSDKGALTSFRNTRRTGGDGVTYPVFSANKVLPSAKVFGKTERTIVIDDKRYIVPDDVELVDYIESSGAQYIDTGITPSATDNFKFSTSIIYTREADEQQMGIRYPARYQFLGRYSSKFTFGYGNSWSYAVGAGLNTQYDVVTELSPGNQKMTVNGVSTTTATASFTSTLPKIYLFAQNGNASSGGPYLFCHCKLFSTKLEINGTLVRAMYPAIKNSVVGMYDFITGQFFTNAGTGSFTAGKKTRTEKTVNQFGTWTDGEIWSTSGGHSTISGWQRTTDMIPVKASTAYTIQCLAGANSGNRRVYLFDANKSYISEIINITGANATLTQTITTTADTAYLTWQLRSTDSNMMLVEGSAAPVVYIPPTLEVPITELYGVGDKTANSYGYQVDVLLGSQGVVDLGTLACRNYFDTSSNRYFFVMTLSDLTANSGVVCSIYTPKYNGSVASLNNMEISVRNGLMYIRNDSFDASTTAGVNAFKSAMSGVYLYYQRNTDPTWQPPTPYTFYTDRQLHGIDYEDVLISNNDSTGSIAVNMAVIALDGSSSWDWQMATSGSVRRFYTQKPIGVPSRPADSTTPKAVCNYPFAFDRYSNAGSITRVDTFNFGISDNYVRFGISADSEIDSVKKWEANLDALKAIGKPLTLIVPLAEADATPLTGLPIISLTEKAQYTLGNTNLVKGEVQAKCLTS